MDSDRYPSSNGDRLPYRTPGSFPETGPSINGDPLPSSSDHNHFRQLSRPIVEEPSSISESSRGRRSSEKPRTLETKERTAEGRRPSATRTCGKCGGPLSGQFVRAINNTFHLECFTCNVGKTPLSNISSQSLIFSGLRQSCCPKVLPIS